MKYLLAISLFIFTAGSIGSGEIKWSNRPLRWTDFTQVNRGAGAFKAQTFSGIRFSLDEENGKIYVDVEAYFDPSESWVVRSSQTPYLLKHEQLHFDITELHARKLRKALFDIQGTDRQSFRSARLWHHVNNLHEEIYQEMVDMQNEYDMDTDHSLIRSKQQAWEDSISNALLDHIEFSSP
jgi:hypothetical protein